MCADCLRFDLLVVVLVCCRLLLDSFVLLLLCWFWFGLLLFGLLRWVRLLIVVLLGWCCGGLGCLVCLALDCGLTGVIVRLLAYGS